MLENQENVVSIMHPWIVNLVWLAHRGKDCNPLHCNGGRELEDDSTYCSIVLACHLSFNVAAFLERSQSAIFLLLLQILFCILHSTTLGSV